MAHTYAAILNGDRIEWRDAAPDAGRPVRVHVTVIEPVPDETPDERAARGKRMADALRGLAKSDPFKDITDPVAWQREIRQDRPCRGGTNERRRRRAAAAARQQHQHLFNLSRSPDARAARRRPHAARVRHQ